MTENASSETLITLTADIISAHLSNNTVAVSDVPALIANVHSALTACGTTPDEPAEETHQPAVSVRSSIKPEHITCLACGSKQSMLKRHLMTAHDLTPETYKARYNLPADYPLVAPNYAEKRRELAKKIGLGRKPGVKTGPRKK